MSKVGENRVPTGTAPEKSECEGNNAPLSQPTGHTEGGARKFPQILPLMTLPTNF